MQKKSFPVITSQALVPILVLSWHILEQLKLFLYYTPTPRVQSPFAKSWPLKIFKKKINDSRQNNNNFPYRHIIINIIIIIIYFLNFGGGGN